jgi:hypothetical protein
MSKLNFGGIPKPVFGGSPTAKNRPDMKARQPGEILLHDAGSTGWGRIRRLEDYKGTTSETSFAHLHNRFFDPAVDPDPNEAA